MINAESVSRIRSQLVGALSQDTPQTALTVLSILVAAIPGVGGPASVLSENVKQKLKEAKLNDVIQQMGRRIDSLSPALQKLTSLEAQIAEMKAVIESDEELRKEFDANVDLMVGELLDTHEIKTLGGVFEIRETVYENLRFSVVAREGGRNYLEGVEQIGSASFETGHGSSQEIVGSRFRGRVGSSSTSSTISRATLGSGATVDLNSQKDGSAVTVRTNADLQDGSAALSITPNSIHFGNKPKGRT